MCLPLGLQGWPCGSLELIFWKGHAGSYHLYYEVGLSVFLKLVLTSLNADF